MSRPRLNQCGMHVPVPVLEAEQRGLDGAEETHQRGDGVVAHWHGNTSLNLAWMDSQTA